MKDLLHLKHSKDGYGTISKQEKHLRASKYGRIRYIKKYNIKKNRKEINNRNYLHFRRRNEKIFRKFTIKFI